MDQLKEILRQAIKYRFWIAVGISALLPIIAYVARLGPDQEEGRGRDRRDHSRREGRQAVRLGDVPNGQYKPIVDEKTEV